MKALQPQAFGERSISNTVVINKLIKREQPFIPFMTAFAKCRICDRTVTPYSKYVPENQEVLSGIGKSYKHLQLRFDIIIYALACYPSSFSRHAVMQKNKSSSRTQQRVLQSLAREGFLNKSQPYVTAGVSFKAVPNKLYNIGYAVDKRAYSKDIDVSEFVPRFNPTLAGISGDTNKLYQQTTFRFDVCLDILTYAAACGEDGFVRTDVMQNMQCLKERTQQRLLTSLVKGGFLIKATPKSGNACIYYFKHSRMEPLLKLLNTINL